MTIDLSETEYEQLLTLVGIGVNVAAPVLEAKGVETAHLEALEKTLWERAHELGKDELVHEHGDHLDLSPEVAFGVEDTLAEYLDAFFWDELSRRLALRDYIAELLPEERPTFDHHEELPEPLKKHVEKYGIEFDEHGVDRLTLVIER